MVSSRRTFALAVVCFLGACVTEGETRRDANQEQLQSFLALQARQDRIEAYATSLAPVDAATAYVRPDSVVVKMRLKEGRTLDGEQQEGLNRFITDLTGIPRARITLAVPASAVSDRGRDE